MVEKKASRISSKASRTSSKASRASSRIGPRANRQGPNKGFLSGTDQQTATALFLVDAVLLIAAVVIFISKPSCKGFGLEVEEDVGADGEKIEIQFFGHNPPPLNQFQGSSSGSIKWGDGWLSWPAGAGGNNNPPSFVPAVLPPTSYNPWRPTPPSWQPPPYLPPSYPSYPMQPPGFPSYPSQPSPPSFPTYPMPPPAFPSYPSQPRPPVFPSFPGGGGGGGGATSASPADQISNTNFECGVQQTKPKLRSSVVSSRIVGGTEPIRHSWPWIASVQRGSMPAYSYHICGGTVVSPRHVITAAHCMGPKKDHHKILQSFCVYLGGHSGNDGERYQLSASRNHPYYGDSSSLKFDLTIFTLKREIQFGPKIQPACLPPRNTYPPGGKVCWAYGWGALKTGAGSTKTLQQVDLAIVPAQQCRRSFSSIKKEYSVCAGTLVGKDTCQGDSGGPLTCQDSGKWVLYGATSYGGTCGSGKPGVYAATSDSMSWICCFMAAIPSCSGITCDLATVPNPPAYGR